MTPPLDDDVIIPGVMRDTILDIVRRKKDIEVVERWIGFGELMEAGKEYRVLECFGSSVLDRIVPIQSVNDVEMGDCEENGIGHSLFEEIRKSQFGSDAGWMVYE